MAGSDGKQRRKLPRYIYLLVPLGAVLLVLTIIGLGPKEVPLGEAVEIVQTYAALLPVAGVDGSVVADSSLLPFPKDRIVAAAISLMSAASDPAEKESFAEIAKTLAFFQPDVGETPISLDETRSGGGTWRGIVEADMQSIEQMLSEAQR